MTEDKGWTPSQSLDIKNRQDHCNLHHGIPPSSAPSKAESMSQPSNRHANATSAWSRPRPSFSNTSKTTGHWLFASKRTKSHEIVADGRKKPHLHSSHNQATSTVYTLNTSHGRAKSPRPFKRSYLSKGIRRFLIWLVILSFVNWRYWYTGKPNKPLSCNIMGLRCPDWPIGGFVKEGFEAVGNAFYQNFADGFEVGASFVAYGMVLIIQGLKHPCV